MLRFKTPFILTDDWKDHDDGVPHPHRHLVIRRVPKMARRPGSGGEGRQSAHRAEPAIGPRRIMEATPRALTQGAMRKSILFAFVLFICLFWWPAVSPASDKSSDPESTLASLEGCLKMSVT
jgi:hypothetical protein